MALKEVSDVRMPVAVKTAVAVMAALIASTWFISSKFIGIETAVASANRTANNVHEEMTGIRSDVVSIKRDSAQRLCLQRELNDWQIRGIKRNSGYCG